MVIVKRSGVQEPRCQAMFCTGGGLNAHHRVQGHVVGKYIFWE